MNDTENINESSVKQTEQTVEGIKSGTEKAGESFFRKMSANIWNAFTLGMADRIKTGRLAWSKEFPIDPDKGWAKWVEKLASNKIIDEDTAKLLAAFEKEPFPLDLIQIVMTRMSILTHRIKSVMDIAALDMQYSNLSLTTPNPAPEDALIKAMIIDPGRTSANRAQLGRLGYHKTQIDNMILSYYRTVDEGTIRACYLRGIITSEIMYERMHELGYTDTRIKEIIQTWELIPGPQDLFLMVAHEAFEPEIYKALGLDKEFPAAQVEWLKKQGISQAWAEKYWIAHWDQPSIGQGFEMLHRGELTLKELDMLFKTIEIPTFWREKLTAIAYQPYTRVDVRRMRDMDVIGDDELVKAYTDIGYAPDKAVKMAQFTLKFNASHEKELTRSAILSSYEKALITRSAAKALLLAQDYSDDLAEYYLTLTEYNIDLETQDLLFENIRERFLLGSLSSVQAKDQLAKMNVDGDKIDALIAKWALKQYKYERLPSPADLEDFLGRNLISETRYRDIMARHGYNPGHIQLYLNRISQTEPEKEALPTKAELKRFLLAKLITEEQYRVRMEAKGYSNYHIELYLVDMKVIKEIPIEVDVYKKPTKGELGRFFIKGLITEAAYRLSMKDIGYTDDNITRFEIDLGKLPSKDDLGGFLAGELLTEIQYKTYMKLHGYSAEDIQRFYTEVMRKVAASAL